MVPHIKYNSIENYYVRSVFLSRRKIPKSYGFGLCVQNARLLPFNIRSFNITGFYKAQGNPSHPGCTLDQNSNI